VSVLDTHGRLGSGVTELYETGNARVKKITVVPTRSAMVSRLDGYESLPPACWTVTTTDCRSNVFG
jgi:hypothetical protein